MPLQIKEYRRRFKELLMADEKAEVYDEFIDFVSEKMNDDFAIQTLGKILNRRYFARGW